MPRKKSRPTHRENAVTVPSNEGGFYKMFWNSMDTNPGTTGPNSPSPGEFPVTPVIIINDSPVGSPCGTDENSCETPAVTLPIKEESREDAAANSNQPFAKTASDSVESHSTVNGDCSSSPTCLPFNPTASQSKNSSPCPSLNDLSSSENPNQTANRESLTVLTTCVVSSESIETPNSNSTDDCLPANQPEETPARENGNQLIEDIQVRDHLTAEEHVEMFPERNSIQLASSSEFSEIVTNADVGSNHSVNLVENCGTSVSNGVISLDSPFCEVSTPKKSGDNFVAISDGKSVNDSARAGNTPNKLSETPMEISEETPRIVIPGNQHPMEGQDNDQEISQEPTANDIFDPNFSTVDGEIVEPPMGEISSPPSPALSEGVGRTLSLLQSLLNAPDEDLEDFNEAFSELPALIGQQHDDSEQNEQHEEEMVECESTQENSFETNIDISNMEGAPSTTVLDNVTMDEENVTRDVSLTNEVVIDEEEENFPTFRNFLPKKIKVDSVGIIRSIKLLKDSMRALYKEYLKDDVMLRTVSAPVVPSEETNESPDEVQETPASPQVNVYPICCVKMERLPDPFIEKTTVTMSDVTFKTWKRQIIQQQNEEKFRHLKVWRRGRTLLWRECELAGMDRATYNEQVAYVKKHRISENSSSDSDSSGDESGNDASFHQCDSAGETSSDEEHETRELSATNSCETCPVKQRSIENQTLSSPPIESDTSTDICLPEDEYVVERSSSNRNSSNKTASALKITIRKTSLSKSEDDKEKPTDEDETFPIPAKPVKSRKVATKRTFRRPSDPVHKATAPVKSTAADAKKSRSSSVEEEVNDHVPKASVPCKATAGDTKKAKSASVENEDLYDQSLLGRRSHEVENFNLLEKWDIPFEEPTLFRSPRAASRLAQLKTKEAFAPVLKRHATPKTTNPTITATAAASTVTTAVSKEVREVVDWLCSKTVEAILFPESIAASTKKHVAAKSISEKESNPHVQPVEVPSEETSAILDESEMSHSETNSTLDASSDFGGSTASLASEDLVPPNDKSPKKSRRRRRVGPHWYKKKKQKSKAANDQSAVKENSDRNELSSKDTGSSHIHSAVPEVEKVGQEKSKSVHGICASPAHSTQVPVVSEGPGQSPHESEDDSAHRVKHTSCQKINELTEKRQPNTVAKTCESPFQGSQPHKEEEVIPPRLTRSKQPRVELDPGLLESIGTRKRKPKADVLGDASQDEGTKKLKQEVMKKAQQSNKPQTSSASTIDIEGLSSTTDVASDNLNTQVPEVSEGPGEVDLVEGDKQGTGKKVESWEPPARMLRSRSRGPQPTLSTTPTAKDSAGKNTDEPVPAEEDDLSRKTRSAEPSDLESPQSPPPEPAEPEPLINSRITRSKKRRSGPAYVAIKSTVPGVLPSVCDIVDSIAGYRLPTPNKLFDESATVARLPTQPVTVCRVQDSSVDGMTLIPTSSSSELSQPPKLLENESAALKSVKSTATLESIFPSNKPNISMPLKDCDASISPTVRSGQESIDVAGTNSELPNKSIVGNASAGVEQPATGEGSEKPVTENTGSGRMKVLDTLNNILAVTPPAEVEHPANTASSALPSLSSDSLPVLPPVVTTVSQPTVSSILTPPTVSSTSLPTFPTSSQDITSILPGTFLNSLINSTLDANLTTYNNDSSSLPDDPDGDLVIDEGEAPEPDARIDVNFWENLTNADLSDTNADFSDEDNNTDLADKIDKIIKDQIHQDPVPVPSLKSKEISDGSKQASEETSPSIIETDKNTPALNRRDSIDERTGLPNNLIQRLRDPRIRSRLLSHLEEVETTDKTPQTSLLLPANNITSNSVGDLHAAKISNSDPRKVGDSIAVHSVSYPVSTAVSSCPSSQVPAMSPVTMGSQLNVMSSGTPGQPTLLTVPSTPLVASVSPSQILGTQGTFVQPAQNTDKPEEPPDPSKVDFLVPPSDDEDEEECIKRQPPKKSKKEVDVELMYKSPLEDLQSEARPAYGERAQRRYAENYTNRRGGDDRQSRWNDRRSRIDDVKDRRFEERGRSHSRDRRFDDRGRSMSRDQRFEDRGRSKSRGRRYDDNGRSQSRDRRFDDRERDRSRSRDRRGYYDCTPREQSRDRRAYDPYCGRERNESTAHQVDMQVPYNQAPWSVGDPAFNHNQTMMRHPLPSPHWQPNYYQEPNIPPHPPIFMPEPPKIDYMETRLINLELLPKTTNLEVTPVKKVYCYFDKDSLQIFRTPPPTYDPNDQPHTIKMMDPDSKEMIDFVQTPRPTSGLTKEYFRHVPPDLTLDDVVKFHFISPAYVMVQDNEEDPSSSSDEEKEELNVKQKILHHRKSALEHKKRTQKSKPVDHNQKRDREPVLELLSKRGNETIPQDQESDGAPRIEMEDDPLQNLLQKLPLLKEQYSLQKSQPMMIPPPPPEWNDVDLRISRAARDEESQLPNRDPSPLKERPRTRSRSRSSSPYRPRRSRSPKRRRRSRSRSPSPQSDMSISPSRSRSRSPSYSRSRKHRRRRSRSSSSERSRSRKTSPKRHSTSISPSRKYSRR